MMVLPCSNNALQFSLTSAIYFMIVLPTSSTEECGLQLTEKMKSKSVVFRNFDKKLCQTECIEDDFIVAACRRSGYEPKKIEKDPTKSCGSTVCNDQCLDTGCRKMCLEVPSLCELHTVSKTGDLTRMKLALSHGREDVNREDWIGRTPVMWAASGGHIEVVELLVSKGANASLTDRFGINILHLASLGGDVEVVQYILSQHLAEINSRVEYKINGTVLCGRTAVMMAAVNGHKDVVELLVREGADVSLVDTAGDSILHCACRGGNVEMVKFILSKKMVKIDRRGSVQMSPVMLAGMVGHKGVVELLVTHGANLSLRDKHGHNILHSASWNGHVEVVEYIISQHTMDINSEGDKQKTPAMFAALMGHKEVVELLVKNGADLSLKDTDGNSILYCASTNGHLEVVKYIISLRTVDMNSRGPGKSTPVMIAGYMGHKEVVEFLVNHGAELSLRDGKSNNILHLATFGGSVEVVKYILSLNAVDINSRGWNMRTAVMMAGGNGHKGLVELFVKHGADLSLADRLGDNILMLTLSHVEVLKYILSLNVVNVNAKNSKKQSAATIARAQGQRDVLVILVSHGAHI